MQWFQMCLNPNTNSYSITLQLIEFTDLPTESVPSAVQTSMSTSKELLPRVIHEPLNICKILPSASRKASPPKPLPKPRKKLIPSRSLIKPSPPPKPDTRSTAFEHDAKKTVRYTRVCTIAVLIVYKHHSHSYRSRTIGSWRLGTGHLGAGRLGLATTGSMDYLASN